MEMSEAELEMETTWAAMARTGDRRAFGQLVERYMRRAYASALGLVGSPADALDLSQEAFVRAYRSMSRFRAGAAFYPWYYKILRNLCFNHLRDRARRARILREAAAGGERPGTTGFAPSPEALAQRSELCEAVWEAMGTLKKEHREILVLREFEGRTYKEIADAVGCPVGTVMSRLFAARKQLKAALDGII
jgi:RNA polymerase sigma-70 factor (ECF subfamily)